ncbi:methyltransferase [Asticcacaulis sp. BYS171W]|uniref:Methyltransferase n=1 Tax=Asticcacaulis aquaticus TaxID=2984212 RepID=A0ABT5HXB6_9CAUL|nr:methyltransferase [Asticcacaulis aquaticus]MDC7684720.1 methyltransferase [Asticcacaulis aquaticus]
MIDPVLDTLLLPFDDGLIDWPQSPALFLRARYGHALQSLDKTKLIADQSFRPDFETLKRAGFTVRDHDDGATYPLVLVLPPRQREEYRALLARAIKATQPGGIVLACVSNLEGAKTVENDLKALTGNIASLSKNKCRAFWATVDEGRDTDLIEAWSQLDAPRPVVDGRFISRPGLFAWDRLDDGSQFLVKNLPVLSGVGADLGGGFGYLTDEMLRASPDVTRIDLYEAERRALDSAAENLKTFGDRVTLHWADVTKGITGGLDFIVANPPFHTGRADRNELGQAFIRSAAAALKPGGAFYMVANRHLPYEETLKAAFRTAVLLAENTHYKVYKAIKGSAK